MTTTRANTNAQAASRSAFFDDDDSELSELSTTPEPFLDGSDSDASDAVLSAVSRRRRQVESDDDIVLPTSRRKKIVLKDGTESPPRRRRKVEIRGHMMESDSDSSDGERPPEIYADPKIDPKNIISGKRTRAAVALPSQDAEAQPLKRTLRGRMPVQPAPRRRPREVSSISSEPPRKRERMSASASGSGSESGQSRPQSSSATSSLNHEEHIADAPVTAPSTSRTTPEAVCEVVQSIECSPPPNPGSLEAKSPKAAVEKPAIEDTIVEPETAPEQPKAEPPPERARSTIAEQKIPELHVVKQKELETSHSSNKTLVAPKTAPALACAPRMKMQQRPSTKLKSPIKLASDYGAIPRPRKLMQSKVHLSPFQLLPSLSAIQKPSFPISHQRNIRPPPSHRRHQATNSLDGCLGPSLHRRTESAPVIPLQPRAELPSNRVSVQQLYKFQQSKEGNAGYSAAPGRKNIPEPTQNRTWASGFPTSGHPITPRSATEATFPLKQEPGFSPQNSASLSPLLPMTPISSITASFSSQARVFSPTSAERETTSPASTTEVEERSRRQKEQWNFLVGVGTPEAPNSSAMNGSPGFLKLL